MSETDRRTRVLDAALLVFARYGYRKTSMDDVAKGAAISRPGLYFYFSSKPELFRAAVQHALEDSVATAQLAVADAERPLPDRLVEAFDQWAGRYVGPMAKEIDSLIDSNPDLLGSMPVEYPKRFLEIVTGALADHRGTRVSVSPIDVARTLVSTARGIKHEVDTREAFRARMTIAVNLYCAA